jgi:hypothetical protein
MKVVPLLLRTHIGTSELPVFEDPSGFAPVGISGVGPYLGMMSVDWEARLGW